MKLAIKHGTIQDADADTIIVNLFKGVTRPAGATGAVDQALGGAISDLIAGGDFAGKRGEVAVFYPRGAIRARRVLVTGLGEQEKFDLEQVRKASAAAILKARELGARHVASIVHGAGIARLPVILAAQAMLEGTLLALYRFEGARHEDEQLPELDAFTIVEFEEGKLQAIEEASRTTKAIIAGVHVARDLVNEPPNVATPTRLARMAEQIAADHNLAVTIGDRAWAAQHNMGAYLAVARGAGESPQFIVLEHNGPREDLDTVVLVGKGITFDTGGISLKQRENMGNMKTDMAGAAAVLGTMKTVGMLDLPLRVIGLAPCTENMPDAHAYRPADVVQASNGKTIEVISTDAEGRMILADALVYAGNYRPKAVIDLATLTGAAIVALGQNVAAGLFSTEDWLREQLVTAGATTHERVWPLPLWDDYYEAIKSDVADIKNSGGQYGGVGASAMFLKSFTNYPWAHLDIAGVANNKTSKAYTPAGATGFGVRLLVEFLRNWRSE